MKIRLSVLAMLLTGLVAGLSAQDCAQAIIDDMTQPPDAALHGAEGMSWGTGAASLDAGGQVPRQNFKGEWFEAMTVWGQVYIPREGSPARNTRCQIRNVVSKQLKKDGKWYTVQSGNPQGAAFVENFANNSSMDAGARDESSNGGGISMIVGVGAWAGHNYHFWPTGSRAPVDVDSVIGLFTSCEARLIIDDPAKPDDRPICRNILQIGGDWWLNMTADWLPDWSANSGIGGCRAKWVTPDWQSFSMCTLPLDQIRANPPCGSPGPVVAVTGVSVNPIAASIAVNATSQLTATISPANAGANGFLRITIDNARGPLQAFIYALDGQMVHTGLVQADKTLCVSRSGLNAGSFILTIRGNGFQKNMKLRVR